MGKVFVVNSIKGQNAKKSFRELKENLEMEYGTNPYNGTLSTCDLGVKRANFTEYRGTKAQEDVINDFIDSQMDKMDTLEADYIECTYLDGSKEFIFFGWANS